MHVIIPALLAVVAVTAYAVAGVVAGVQAVLKHNAGWRNSSGS